MPTDSRDILYSLFNRRVSYAAWFVLGVLLTLSSYLVFINLHRALLLVLLLAGVFISGWSAWAWACEPTRFHVRQERLVAREAMRPRPAVKTSVEGISIFRSDGTLVVAIPWQSIAEIAVFKRDLLTTDSVCLSLKTTAETWEVNEDARGWSELVESIDSSLPAAVPSGVWYSRVEQPAFATNFEVIFSRPGG